MPCTDRPDDGSYDRDRRNALTALLCAVMRKDPAALAWAERWARFHNEIDRRRKSVKDDWQDDEISRLGTEADKVLLAFYATHIQSHVTSAP